MTTMSRRDINRSLAALLGCSAASLWGCSAGDSGGVVQAFTQAKSSVPREQHPVVTDAQQMAVQTAQNMFALEAYRALSNAADNLVFSPYSLLMTLSMGWLGARGETEKQMAQVFHCSLPQAQWHAALNAADLSLNASQDKYRLAVANALFGHARYALRQGFLDQLAQHYGAWINAVDFGNTRQCRQAEQTINEWASQQTAGKIKALIAKGSLSSDTRLVLTNAIYFKANWGVPFKNDEAPTEFTLRNGEKIRVPTMYHQRYFRHMFAPDVQAVELPYQEERLRMVVLLPAEGQFDAFARSFDHTRLHTILSSLHSREVMLRMPKFSVLSRLDCKPPLMQAGMVDAFTPGRADFSGLSEARDLAVSAVRQQAFIAVDEIGTEAAAATAMDMMYLSYTEPISVLVNRPFLYLIRDEKTGMILFLGKVLDPRKTE